MFIVFLTNVQSFDSISLSGNKMVTIVGEAIMFFQNILWRASNLLLVTEVWSCG